MAIPSVENPGLQPGGGLANSLENLNALTRSNIETKYLPLTVPAKGLSELAYASFVQPQYLAKLMGNQQFVANMTPEQKEQAKILAVGAGTGQTTGNSLLNIPSLLSQGRDSALGNIVNNVAKAFGLRNKDSSSTTNSMLNTPSLTPQANANLNSNSGYLVDKNINNINGTQKDINPSKNSNVEISSPPTKPITDNGSYNPETVSAPSNDKYAENAAHYASIIKEGETLGNERGKTISDLGKQQIDLSNSGVILDRLTGIIKNPEFNNMRSQIPYFQDKQLWYLSKQGNKAQQDLIGDFISTAQAFKASTVNSFKGKALEKEFNLADKIKIDENDTMSVAQGKLRSLSTLKDIAENKNDMILDLMQNKHMNEGDAVKQVNKLINTKNIEDQVNNLLNPPVTIMYKNNQKYNIPNDKVEAAKKAGYSNGR